MLLSLFNEKTADGVHDYNDEEWSAGRDTRLGSEKITLVVELFFFSKDRATEQQTHSTNIHEQ